MKCTQSYLKVLNQSDPEPGQTPRITPNPVTVGLMYLKRIDSPCSQTLDIDDGLVTIASTSNAPANVASERTEPDLLDLISAKYGQSQLTKQVPARLTP